MKFLSAIVKHSLQPAKKPHTVSFSASPTVIVNEPINHQGNGQNIQQTESQPATMNFTEIAATDDNKTETIGQETANIIKSSGNFEAHKDGFATEVSTALIKNRKKTIVTSSESINQVEEQVEEPLQSSSSIAENNSKNTSLDKSLLPKHQTLQDQARTEETAEASQTSLNPKQSTGLDNTKTQVKKSTALNKSHLQKHQTPHDQTRTEQSKNSANTQQRNNNYFESRTSKQTQVQNTEYLNQNINNTTNNHNYHQQQTEKLIKTIDKKQTPQVRIGQINVLIEDQAKTVSKSKPAAKTQSSSPFGYRGL